MDSNLTCSAAIGLDSALNKDGNYYPQMFLKECKYIKQSNDKVYYGRHINFFWSFRWVWWGIVFFFHKRLKKFQKRDEFFLCKPFPYLYYSYTLYYKKVLLKVLVTSYTACLLLTSSFARLYKCLAHNTKHKPDSLSNP